jgi:hypothetical protein
MNFFDDYLLYSVFLWRFCESRPEDCKMGGALTKVFNIGAAGSPKPSLLLFLLEIWADWPLDGKAELFFSAFCEALSDSEGNLLANSRLMDYDFGWLPLSFADYRRFVESGCLLELLRASDF